MGAGFATFGTMITVCSFTPSRIGIITSRRTYSKPLFVGLNSCGVSAGRVCAIDIENAESKTTIAKMPAIVACGLIVGDLNIVQPFVIVRMRELAGMFIDQLLHRSEIQSAPARHVIAWANGPGMNSRTISSAEGAT